MAMQSRGVKGIAYAHHECLMGLQACLRLGLEHLPIDSSTHPERYEGVDELYGLRTKGIITEIRIAVSFARSDAAPSSFRLWRVGEAPATDLIVKVEEVCQAVEAIAARQGIPITVIYSEVNASHPSCCKVDYHPAGPEKAQSKEQMSMILDKVAWQVCQGNERIFQTTRSRILLHFALDRELRISMDWRS